MILDNLKNIEIYKGISQDLYEGLEFILNATPDIELGNYKINQNTIAIVSEYETKENFERGYEAHKHVVDIQYPIVGIEKVKWSPIDNMEVNIPYDDIKDRTFFKNPSPQGTEVIIGNGIFAIMFPNDGHSPQHYIEKPQLIKKITVKVSIS
jgi:YhcH/YjgK/YiaL family protein